MRGPGRRAKRRGQVVLRRRALANGHHSSRHCAHRFVPKLAPAGCCRGFRSHSAPGLPSISAPIMSRLGGPLRSRPSRSSGRPFGSPDHQQDPPICPAAALPKRAFDRAAPRGVARSASRCQQFWGGDFDVAHVLFVAVRRPHTEREGFRHARNVAAE